MLRVGLTGNVASGKSTVARVWQDLGATIIDADVLAREAVAHGTPGLRRVVDLFGPGVIARDGSLDRARVRELVFRDADARVALERAIHPEIARLRAAAEADRRAAGERLVVHVIPLLFEAGLTAAVDVVVFVDASEATRLNRLIRDRGIAPDLARRMVDAQLPAGPKREAATFVIENEGTLAALEATATSLWHELERRARAAQ